MKPKIEDEDESEDDPIQKVFAGFLDSSRNTDYGRTISIPGGASIFDFTEPSD